MRQCAGTGEMDVLLLKMSCQRCMMRFEMNVLTRSPLPCPVDVRSDEIWKPGNSGLGKYESAARCMQRRRIGEGHCPCTHIRLDVYGSVTFLVLDSRRQACGQAVFCETRQDRDRTRRKVILGDGVRDLRTSQKTLVAHIVFLIIAVCVAVDFSESVG